MTAPINLSGFARDASRVSLPNTSLPNNRPLDLTKENKVSNSFKAALDKASKIPGKAIPGKKDRNVGTKIASNNINSQTQGQIQTDYQGDNHRRDVGNPARRDVGNPAKGTPKSHMMKNIWAEGLAANDYSIADEKDGLDDSFFNRQQQIELLKRGLENISFD